MSLTYRLAVTDFQSFLYFIYLFIVVAKNGVFSLWLLFLPPRSFCQTGGLDLELAAGTSLLGDAQMIMIIDAYKLLFFPALALQLQTSCAVPDGFADHVSSSCTVQLVPKLFLFHSSSSVH